MKETILMLLHLDFPDNRGIIKDLLPMKDIQEYAKKNNIWVIEVYNDRQVTQFDGIRDYQVYDTRIERFFKDYKYVSRYFEDCDIILVGGYRSLCLKQAFDSLKTANTVYINPDWVVSDPSYTNYDLYDLWEYQEAEILMA